MMISRRGALSRRHAWPRARCKGRAGWAGWKDEGRHWERRHECERKCRPESSCLKFRPAASSRPCPRPDCGRKYRRPAHGADPGAARRDVGLQHRRCVRPSRIAGTNPARTTSWLRI